MMDKRRTDVKSKKNEYSYFPLNLIDAGDCRIFEGARVVIILHVTILVGKRNEKKIYTILVFTYKWSLFSSVSSFKKKTIGSKRD